MHTGLKRNGAEWQARARREAGLDARIPGLTLEPKPEADGGRGSAGSPPPPGELQALNKAVVTPGWTAFVPFISTLH